MLMIGLVVLSIVDEDITDNTGANVVMLLLSTLMLGLLCWRAYSNGLGHSYHFWHVLEAICIIVMFATECVSIATGNDACLITFMTVPILLVCMSRTLRHTCFIVSVTLWDSIPVYILGVLCIVSYAMIGYMIFRDVPFNTDLAEVPSEAFSTFKESVLSAMFMFTNENYPSLMQTIYVHKPWAPLYFMPFALFSVPDTSLSYVTNASVCRLRSS